MKLRFPKNTNEQTIFDIKTIVKHDDVSMKILKISPSLDQKTELQKKGFPKVTKNVKKVISAHWSPDFSRKTVGKQ